MDAILHWGVTIIVTIQQIHGPVTDSIFRVITFLGEAEFFLILLPLIFWCVDYRLGAQFTILLLFSNYIHIGLKDLLQQPRPSDINSGVLQLSHAEGYGLPSGHTQSATVVWGSIAARLYSNWFRVTAIGIIILVGFSRVYLGVHFPTDVLAGWLIGIVLIIIYLKLQPNIEKWLVKRRLGIQMLLGLGIPLVLLIAHPVKESTDAMGILAGTGVGVALTQQYIHFSAGGPWWQRALRFIIGIAAVLGLYFGLKVVIPDGESALDLVFRFLRYGLVGVWVTFGAPWLFRLLKLVYYPT